MRFSAESEKLPGGYELPVEMANDQYWRFAEMDPADRPFKHPFYWAAFTFSGT